MDEGGLLGGMHSSGGLGRGEGGGVVAIGW